MSDKEVMSNREKEIIINYLADNAEDVNNDIDNELEVTVYSDALPATNYFPINCTVEEFWKTFSDTVKDYDPDMAAFEYADNTGNQYPLSDVLEDANLIKDRWEELSDGLFKVLKGHNLI